MSHHRTVYVVEGDREVRRSLASRLGVVGAEAWPFASGAELLAMIDHLAPACVLLDLDGAGAPALQLLRQVVERRPEWPIVALSVRDEAGFAIAAMKLGAIDFLPKSAVPAVLAAALAPAWQKLERAIEESEVRRSAQERVAGLTARERGILSSLLAGQANKTVAHQLGISVRTVEMHRSHILAKMPARNLAEAAVVAIQAGMVPNSGLHSLARPIEPGTAGPPSQLPADASPYSRRPLSKIA